MRRSRDTFREVQRRKGLHVIGGWRENARPYTLRCEGVMNPHGAVTGFAADHGDIDSGARFFRKAWEDYTGQEFTTVHCTACANSMGET